MMHRALISTTIVVLVVGLNAWAQVSLRRVTLARDPIVLTIVDGSTPDGRATVAWREAVRHRYSDVALDSVATEVRRPTSTERAWRDLIAERRHAWERSVDSLRMPFADTRPPDSVTILLGLHGGNDAFVHGPTTICFDLGRLQKEYGDAGSEMNRGRIDRFFAHEFTHLLHKAWARDHPVRLTTPLEEALWECLVEGVGNYRSLSPRWVGPGGTLTDHARTVLARLEPVFAERISALSTATTEEAPRLIEGLSDGPFDRKWGALTVALWLAQEAQGDDRRLKPWIDAGLDGVLILAHRYLPEELRARMPSRR